MRFALAALTLFAACGAPPKDDGPPRPRSRSTGCGCAATGARADRGGPRGEHGVLPRVGGRALRTGRWTCSRTRRPARRAASRRRPASTPGRRGATSPRAASTCGAESSCRLPPGSRGRPTPAHLDTLTMHAAGRKAGRGRRGRTGYWMRAAGIRPAPARGPVRVRWDAEPGGARCERGRPSAWRRAGVLSAALLVEAAVGRYETTPAHQAHGAASRRNRWHVKARSGPSGQAPGDGGLRAAPSARHGLKNPIQVDAAAPKLELKEHARRLHRRRAGDARHHDASPATGWWRTTPGGWRISRVECDGRVQAVDGERWAGGEHADYDNDEGAAGDDREPRGPPGHQHDPRRPGRLDLVTPS